MRGIVSILAVKRSGLYFIGVLLAFGACRNNAEQDKNINPDNIQETLIEANKQLVKSEEQDIIDFLDRYSWEMVETGTGLRYMIYRQGEGKKIMKNDIVVLDYKVSFLTGDVLESSAENGKLEFLVSKGNVVSGLQEGILYLRVGDKAKLILPSHLAYGLTGKPGQIPPKTTLIYDIEVLEVK